MIRRFVHWCNYGPVAEVALFRVWVFFGAVIGSGLLAAWFLK